MPGGAQLLFAERVENIEPATHSVRCLRNVEWRWTMIEVERVGHFNINYINSDRSNFEPALLVLNVTSTSEKRKILNHFESFSFWTTKASPEHFLSHRLFGQGIQLHISNLAQKKDTFKAPMPSQSCSKIHIDTNDLMFLSKSFVFQL